MDPSAGPHLLLSSLNTNNRGQGWGPNMLTRPPMQVRGLSTVPAPQRPVSTFCPSPFAGFDSFCSESRLGLLLTALPPWWWSIDPNKRCWNRFLASCQFLFLPRGGKPGGQNNPSCSSWLSQVPGLVMWVSFSLWDRESIFHTGDLLPAFSGTEEGGSVLALFPQ